MAHGYLAVEEGSGGAGVFVKSPRSLSVYILI